MKVFVTGATGFIGRQLVAGLLEDGHAVTVLTRSSAKAASIFGSSVGIVEGDPTTAGTWMDEISGTDGVVNLCGEPILKKKWTPARKDVLLRSRVVPTELLVEAMKTAAAKPKVFASGSAIGYYGNRGDAVVTEEDGPGEDFAAKLNIAWESAANKAAEHGVRVVNLRTGFVLGHGGGLTQMVPPFKFFVGGPIGTGRQYLSWIHISDHVGITKTALTEPSISGPINLTAPNPATNKDFAKSLGRAIRRPSWLPVPAFALRLMFGEGASLMLEGQRVAPNKALSAGYKYQFHDLDSALADILS